MTNEDREGEFPDEDFGQHGRVPVLIEAVQEQQAQLDLQHAVLAGQQVAIEELRAELRALRAELAASPSSAR